MKDHKRREIRKRMSPSWMAKREKKQKKTPFSSTAREFMRGKANEKVLLQ